MNHEYSTYAFIILISVIFVVGIINAIDSEDMDILCNTNNSLIKKVAGTWVCSETHYAEGYYHDYITPLTINMANAGVYYNITGYEGLISYGIDSLGNSIRINKDGIYKIIGTVSFRGGNGGEYEVELFINGISHEECSFFRTTSTVAIGDATLTCIKTLSNGDMLIMKIKDISPPAQSVEIDALNFNIVEVQ